MRISCQVNEVMMMMMSFFLLPIYLNRPATPGGGAVARHTSFPKLAAAMSQSQQEERVNCSAFKLKAFHLYPDVEWSTLMENCLCNYIWLPD